MEQLARALEMFDILFGTLPVPVFLFDCRQFVVAANQAFCDSTGRDPGMIGRLALCDVLKNPRLFFEGDVVWKGGQSYYLNDLLSAQGDQVPVKLYYSRLVDSAREVSGVLMIALDQREAVAARQRAERLQLENSGLRAHVGDGAHEATLIERQKLEQDVQAARDFLENVVESCGDGLMIIDARGVIVRVNGALASMLGKTQEAVQGTFIAELGPLDPGDFQLTTGETWRLGKDYFATLAGQLEKYIALEDGQKLEHWQYFAFHQSGKLVPLDLTAAMQKRADGFILRAVCAVRDLTNKKLAEREIREMNTFLERIVDTSYDGIVVGDHNGVCLFTNRAMERITGYSKEKLAGSCFSELLEIESYPVEMIQERFHELGHDGLVSFESSMRRRDGRKIFLEHGISLINDDEGNCIVTVSFIRDVTDKKKAARELQNAYEFRNQFFTNITHEFRTPLTLAIGPLEEVLRGTQGAVSGRVKGQLEIALRNSRRLLKLVNQLLDFSAMESAAGIMTYENKHIEVFVGAVLEAFAFVARQKQITIGFSADETLPPVPVDVGALEKILFNIIGNAFRYTPEGGVVNVAIAHVPDGSDCLQYETFAGAGGENDPPLQAVPYVCIAVSDSGPGIQPQNLQRIFERFQQSGERFALEQGGSGIGLANARELVRLMGGNLSVKSEYGRGATFTVYLPRSRPAGDVIGNGAGDELPALGLNPDVELSDIGPQESAALEYMSGTKPLVLVVDDSSDVRRYIAGIVGREFDVMSSGSGADGLQKMKEYAPDVILCDVMMPGMDGLELLRRVRANPGLRRTPFVFLTARADIDMKVTGIEGGADDYIVKPFHARELLARVRAQLRMRALMSSNEDKERTITTLTQQLQNRFSYGNIIGRSAPMRRLFQLLESIRDSSAIVLLTGETGTGKELVAGSIHYSSPRKNRPLVSVNCGAVPRELMERELFGHVRGAFTGAVETKKGYFEEADGGTLLLDEIGEMDVDMQVKMLRVIERGEIVRVGDAAAHKINVRIIAATNRDLRADVAAGKFREDLYYRIHVLPVHLPPLRERPEDIPLLIEHFLERFRQKNDRHVPELLDGDMQALMTYSYPGNVRELENLMERYCLLGQPIETLLARQLREDTGDVSFSCDAFLHHPSPLQSAGKAAKARAERDMIELALRQCGNNHSRAAKLLNISRAYFYRKLKEYGISGS